MTFLSSLRFEPEHPALEVVDLEVGYGARKVLEGVSLAAGSGELTCVIGHNGAGKTTLLKALMGIVPMWGGSVFVGGTEVGAPAPREMVSSGVSLMLQGGRVFPGQRVEENLRLAASVLPRPKRRHAVERALEAFPKLKGLIRRQASSLSGGERQTLALAMTWCVAPSVMLLDEPSHSLTDSLTASFLEDLRRLCETEGVAGLVVEQKVAQVLKVSQRAVVLRQGKVSFSGESVDLSDPERLRHVFL